MPSPNENLIANMNCSYQTYNVRNGVWGAIIADGTSLSLSRVRSTVSVQTPGFKTMKRRLLPNNPYSKSVAITSDPLISINVPIKVVPETDTSSKVINYYVTNCLRQYCSFDAIGTAEDPAPLALMKMLKQLSETKANTLVSAAEMHKTVALVTQNATKLYRAIKALKRADFRDFTDVLGITTTSYTRSRFNKRYDRAKSADRREYQNSKTVTEQRNTHMSNFLSDTWLEYSYGWKPLMKDIYDHAQALAELNIERQNVVRFVKGRAKTTYKGTVSTEQSLWLWTRIQEDKRFAEYGCSFRLQGGSLNTFSQLGIDNPMELAWELIPFSFVADWFLPVGNFLRSLTATVGLIFVDGYSSIRNVFQLETSFVSSGKTSLSGVSLYGPMTGHGSATRTRMDIVRSRLSSFPYPVIPEPHMPRRGDDYGLSKALSASALLQSLFLREKSTGMKRFRI